IRVFDLTSFFHFLFLFHFFFFSFFVFFVFFFSFLFFSSFFVFLLAFFFFFLYFSLALTFAWVALPGFWPNEPLNGKSVALSMLTGHRISKPSESRRMAVVC
ncbi:hypothetical protein D7Y11_43155, partial [Corallococcus sp. AB018]